MSESIKTTKEDFEIFQRSVRYWLERFGLKGWAFLFSWVELDDDWAMATIQSQNRSIIFKYTTSAENALPDENDPDLHGFHEVCEVLLDRFWELVRKADPTSLIVTNYELTTAVHSVVRLFENVVYRPRAWESGIPNLPPGVFIQPVTAEKANPAVQLAQLWRQMSCNVDHNPNKTAAEVLRCSVKGVDMLAQDLGDKLASDVLRIANEGGDSNAIQNQSGRPDGDPETDQGPLGSSPENPVEEKRGAGDAETQGVGDETPGEVDDG